MKAGDKVETINGVATVLHLRPMNGGVVIVTTAGNFTADEVEPIEKYSRNYFAHPIAIG